MGTTVWRKTRNLKSAVQMLGPQIAPANCKHLWIIFLVAFTVVASANNGGDLLPPVSITPSNQQIDQHKLTRHSSTVAMYLNAKAIDPTLLPRAYIVSKNRLIELTCPIEPRNCASKVAIFDKRYFHILLEDSLVPKGQILLESFIIHELTHVYQYFRPHYKTRNPCNLQLQNEREAYRLQNRFLSDSGLHFNLGQDLRGVLCRPLP